MLEIVERADVAHLYADTAPDEAEATPCRPPASRPVLFLTGMASIAALYLARDVIIPVVLSALLALLLRPIHRKLRRVHVPDIVAAFFSVAIVVALFVAAMLTVARQGQYWLAEAPKTVESVRNMLPRDAGPLDSLKLATDAVQEMTQPTAAQTPVQVEVRSPDQAYAIIGASGHFLAAAVIVFVLTFFFLAFSDTLLKQAVESRPSFAQKRNVVELVYQVESGVSRYLATITLINAGLGIVTATALWLLGIPNPLLWGVLATVLNYVPHVGGFVCMAVLFFVGSVVHQSLWSGAEVAGVFAAITAIESYLVTPLVLSRSLQLSPLAVILAVLFWGWLWGIPGALMAAPLLTMMKIVCDQFEPLAPLGIVLGGKTAADRIVKEPLAA